MSPPRSRDSRADRVLIVAPVGRDASLIIDVLARDHIAAEVVESLHALAREINTGAGAAIVTEEVLEHDAIRTVAAQLAEAPSWSDFPFLLLTSTEGLAGSRESLEAAVRPLGNVTMIERPVRIASLLSSVRSALRARRHQYEMRDHLIERAALLIREQAAREEAENASRAKDEFLAILSHELRTPLTAMLGWLRIIRSGWLREEQVQQALETIERNTRLQTALINDLLDVSRIIAGKLDVERQRLELAPVVHTAVETLRREADAKQITLATDIQPAVVLGDSVRLQQIVANLISNAVKFTPPGGRVAASVDVCNGRARVIVRDSGEGIAPAVLPHIFERFRQGDSTVRRKHGGLGLGLAIVRHLVELHDGSVHAANDSSGGAVFTVEIPLAVGEPGWRRRSAADAVYGVMPPRLDGIRVLVVDDHDDSRDFMASGLEHFGASVTTADCGAAALKIVEGQDVDILISDLAMPDGDGYCLIERVRAAESATCSRALPAIAITAFVGQNDEQRTLAAGFDCHVAKPVDAGQLAHIVAQTYERTRGRTPRPSDPTPAA